MATATASVFIDTHHPQKDGKCAVSIRVTYQRVRRFYSTGIDLTPSEIDRFLTGKRRTEAEKQTHAQILDFLKKANDAIKALPVFTFGQFKDIYLSNRGAADSVEFGFDKYIAELRTEDREGTAVTYECAKKSLNSFKPGLKFADIDAALLRKYQKWMEEKGNSPSTVGIYLRSLRTIFNRTSIDRTLYPFGTTKNKFSIPASRNIKKALTIEEIGKIFTYDPAGDKSKEQARDYWIFLYLCNGMNVKDMCLLKRGDIDGDILTYKRAKTGRSKREPAPAVVSLKGEAKAVINKYGQPSINPESFIFPYFKKGMTEKEQRDQTQLLVKFINKHMKAIAREIGINKPITTYYARHSFATVLLRSGASVEFISEALTHSSMATTKSYLDGFQQDTIHKTTDALIPVANIS